MTRLRERSIDEDTRVSNNKDLKGDESKLWTTIKDKIKAGGVTFRHNFTTQLHDSPLVNFTLCE